MSNTKKVHPIPLKAIRGSFELCKFRLGRLVHRYYSEERDTAHYWATIEEYPDGRAGEDFSAFELLNRLNACYPGQVLAIEPMFQKGRWTVTLLSSSRTITAGLEWLS